MSYKIVRNDNYLMHFNKNHSKANGQFISGDGDDDGIIDDHHNYSRNKRGATSGSNIKSTTAKSTSAKSTNTNKKKIDPHEAV